MFANDLRTRAQALFFRCRTPPKPENHRVVSDDSEFQRDAMRSPQDIENRDARAASTSSNYSWDAVAEKLAKALEAGRPEAELRAIVHQWCAEAKARDLAPEQF